MTSRIVVRRTLVPSFRMQIFNISDLFATPVAATSIVDTLKKTSCRRRRKRAPNALSKTKCFQRVVDKENNDTNTNASLNPKTVALCDKGTNTVVIEEKKTKRKRYASAASELTSQISTAKTIESFHSNSNKPGRNEDGNSTENPATENMKDEVNDLIASLELITSQRNALEKSLNELREENDRLARNNEDLKDELKEMTDEALELSVEKQRLLSKIGTLKKQLLNRPK